MNEIQIQIKAINGCEVPAVTSLQVAGYFHKEHDKVLRKIKNIECSQQFMLANFGEHSYIDNKGNRQPCWLMTRDGFSFLAMGFTGKKAAHWKESFIAAFNDMEKQLLATHQNLPNFSDPVAAARAWADAQEAARLAQNTAQAAIAERDHAIKTKAEIGCRREATAMATASAAVRTVTRLENQLGNGKKYKCVRAIPWLLKYFTPSQGMYTAVGYRLTKMSQEMKYRYIQVEDTKFGSVNAYHIDCIAEFKNRLDNDPAMMAKYRNYF